MIQVVIIEGGDEFSIPKNRILVEVELSMPFSIYQEIRYRNRKYHTFQIGLL